MVNVKLTWMLDTKLRNLFKLRLFLLPLLFLSVMLSGCGISLSNTDSVNVSLTLATKTGEGVQKFSFDTFHKSELFKNATFTNYDNNGYTGQTISVPDVTFSQLTQISDIATKVLNTFQGAITAKINRSGKLVTISGSIDLSSMPANDYFVSFSMDLPSKISSSVSGKINGNSVTWSLNSPNQANLNTTTQYFDPSIVGFWLSFFYLALIVVVAVVIIYILAKSGPSRLRKYLGSN